MIQSFNANKNLLTKRMYAFYLDFFLLFFTSMSLMFVIRDFVGTIMFSSPLSLIEFTRSQLFRYGMYANLALSFAYFSLVPYFCNGQTVGKLVFNLKMKRKEKELTLMHYSARAFYYLTAMNFFPLVLIIPFFTKNAGGLFEMIFKSEVSFTFEAEEKAEAHIEKNQLYVLHASASEDIYYIDDQAA